MNFKSVSELNTDVLSFISRLPKDFDLIAGVPRSGLLAANLIALYMNLPLTDVEGVIAHRLIEGGKRLGKPREDIFNNKRLKVLVVDDSILNGTQLLKVKDRLRDACSIHHIEYAAMYAGANCTDLVDHYHQVVLPPRVFEWNLMHHQGMDAFCFDIDGVLCRDPSDTENDDGTNYRRFLESVPPWIVPSKQIGWLVTCRLEKYRALTEKWLAEHAISYSQLIMMDLPSKEARLAQGGHAKFKADFYMSVDAILFIESNPAQAAEIARLSGKAVYSFGSGEMFPGSPIKQKLRLVSKASRRATMNLAQLMSAFFKRIGV